MRYKKLLRLSKFQNNIRKNVPSRLKKQTAENNNNNNNNKNNNQKKNNRSISTKG